MTPLEAFADAINQFEGWHYGTRAWRNRNPGNLRPFEDSQATDGDGYRVFPSMAEGWQALVDDLSAKFAGTHGLVPATSTLLDLLGIYAPAGDANNPNAYTLFVCGWVSSCLGRTVYPTTTLAAYLAL